MFVFIDEGEPGDDIAVIGTFDTAEDAERHAGGRPVIPLWSLADFHADQALTDSEDDWEDDWEDDEE